jgi:hypothetical protein
MPPVIFCSGYFGDRVSLFAQADLAHVPPSLDFPPLLGQHIPPCSAFLQWDGGHANIFAWAGLEQWSSQSQPPGSLGSQAPLCPAIGWNGVLQTLFCLGWHPTVILLISASQWARITDTSHWCLAPEEVLKQIVSICLMNSYNKEEYDCKIKDLWKPKAVMKHLQKVYCN